MRLYALREMPFDMNLGKISAKVFETKLGLCAAIRHSVRSIGP
jgi:hypothetical protein